MLDDPDIPFQKNPEALFHQVIEKLQYPLIRLEGVF